jgi:hemerythrin-like domain-containing protein
MVLPIGPLMVEHRLIERMIAVMETEVQRVQNTGKVDPGFIDIAVDFIRTYADRCHHGKEEEILFRELKKKRLEEDHKRMMEELIADHIWGRKTTKSLVEAKARYISGDVQAMKDIIALMTDLVGFYPRHIAKEDKGFFKPVMSYFTKPELDAMLKEEYEFDKVFVHRHYGDIVSAAESKK